MNLEQACNILGVSQMASPEEIRMQYLYKANLLHPDKTQYLAENLRNKAEEELKLVNQAHDFLRLPSNRPLSTTDIPASDISSIRVRPTVAIDRFSSTYHRRSCELVRNISSQNLRFLTKDEARQRGLKRCSVCQP
jgi:hypothetical protein